MAHYTAPCVLGILYRVQIRTRPNCTRYRPIETIAALDDLQSLAYSQNCSRPTYSLIKVSNNRNLYGLRELWCLALQWSSRSFNGMTKNDKNVFTTWQIQIVRNLWVRSLQNALRDLATWLTLGLGLCYRLGVGSSLGQKFANCACAISSCAGHFVNSATHFENCTDW